MPPSLFGQRRLFRMVLRPLSIAVPIPKASRRTVFVVCLCSARSALICSRIEWAPFGTGAVATRPWAEVNIASNVMTSAIFIN
jgi:hypothetical protein